MTQPLAGKHILIVEDEPVFRSLLDSWLSSLGDAAHEKRESVSR